MIKGGKLFLISLCFCLNLQRLGVAMHRLKVFHHDPIVLWNLSAFWDIIVDPRASKFCSKIFKSFEAPQTPRVIQNWTKMDFRNHKKRNKIFFDRKELLFNSAHAHAFTWKIWTQNCVSQAFRRSKSFHLWKLFFAKFFFSRGIGTIRLLQFSN